MEFTQLLLSDGFVEIINQIIKNELETLPEKSNYKILDEKIKKMNKSAESYQLTEWKQFLLEEAPEAETDQKEKKLVQEILVLVSNITQIDLKVAGRDSAEWKTNSKTPFAGTRTSFRFCFTKSSSIMSCSSTRAFPVPSCSVK